MPPIIVCQAKEYYHDTHFKIPLDLILHLTPSGYMDRDSWIKSMTKLSIIYGASPINNPFFYYGHYIHFNNRALSYMEDQNIQPFFMKEC